MAEEKSRRFPWKSLLAVVVLAGVAAILFSAATSGRTSTTEYCISCHEMDRYKLELEKSSHAVDKDKQPIQCAQCHIPAGGIKKLAVKATLGAKDIWAHYWGNPTHLDRRQLQPVARRFVADANCRACHQDLTKNVKGEPLAEIGKLCHDAYLGKNGCSKDGCAGCHTNMAHLPEFDRHYNVNAKFAARLPLEKEPK